MEFFYGYTYEVLFAIAFSIAHHKLWLDNYLTISVHEFNLSPTCKEDEQSFACSEVVPPAETNALLL